MNECHFVGRITNTPSLNYIDDKAVSKFFLAVKRNRSNDADFVPCVVWGGYAESLANSLKKGQLIAVNAKFTSTNYMDNGRDSVFYEFTVTSVEFL